MAIVWVRGSCPGGNYLRGNSPGDKSLGVIVLGGFNVGVVFQGELFEVYCLGVGRILGVVVPGVQNLV